MPSKGRSLASKERHKKSKVFHLVSMTTSGKKKRKKTKSMARYGLGWLLSCITPLPISQQDSKTMVHASAKICLHPCQNTSSYTTIDKKGVYNKKYNHQWDSSASQESKHKKSVWLMRKECINSIEEDWASLHLQARF